MGIRERAEESSNGWLAGQWGLFRLVLGVGWVNETQGSSMAQTGVFGL
jgi:hypothetical protein